MSMPIFLALLAWSGIGLAAILLVAVVFAVMIRIENRAKRVAASLITECTYCGPEHVCDTEHDGCCSQCCHVHGPCRMCILDDLAQDAEMGGRS